MTEKEWIASDDPVRMLRWLTGTAAHEDPRGRRISARKLRLFAAALVRQVLDRVRDDVPCDRCGGSGLVREEDWFPGDETVVTCTSCGGTGRINCFRRTVEVAERLADGGATEQEMSIAYGSARVTRNNLILLGGPEFVAAHLACNAVSCSPGLPEYTTQSEGAAVIPLATQAAILRDVVGNPFRRDHQHVPFHKLSVWLAWNDGAVRRIAEGIYAERAWERMPVLADALLDAGCDDEAILTHCQGEDSCSAKDCNRGRCCRCSGEGCSPHGMAHGGCDGSGDCRRCGGTGRIPLRGPHARGCWVGDLILGKE